MAMTKGDFEAVAEAVAEAKRAAIYNLPEEDRETAMVALEVVTKELATACAQQRRGGAFKRDTFVEACGFPEV